VVVCATAQHRELLDSVLRLFGIEPEIDLDLMEPGQTLSALAGRVLPAFDALLARERFDRVLVQGDTTTVLAASLAAFHRGVPIGHIEAGLRTSDLRNPFPEEMNRRVTDLVAGLHFAPTESAAAHLRRENIGEDSIHVTGNTVVDALNLIAERLPAPSGGPPVILITSHRRESFGEPMTRAFRAISRLARRFPDHRFLFPVHPNPNVRAAAAVFEGLSNIVLCEPADYAQFAAWMRDCRIILTDSGGVQEEAPAFGKPTLVLRDTTERPEGVAAGVARLVGTDEDRIFAEAERLLTDPTAYDEMARVANPYGDGLASERIAAILAGRPVRPFRAAR
jgi:UDP-N-acetylglucosamine 2-epimerase (non-hydrolysing)